MGRKAFDAIWASMVNASPAGSPLVADVGGLILEHDVGTLGSPDLVADGPELVRWFCVKVTAVRNGLRRPGEESARARFDWPAFSATLEHSNGTPAPQAPTLGTQP
jgi:hypothetical protein